MTEFREDAAAAAEWVARYLEGVRERPVLAQVEPREVRAALPAAPPETAEAVRGWSEQTVAEDHFAVASNPTLITCQSRSTSSALVRVCPIATRMNRRSFT